MQLAPHALRHFRRARRRARQVARGIVGFQIAPALEGRAWTRLHQYHLAVEYDLATLDAILAGRRTNIEYAFPAGDLPADHPLELAACSELSGALREHPGGVYMLRLLSALFLLLKLEHDPVFKVSDGAATDAKLDEM